MNVILKNGESMALENGATAMQAAMAISEGLARNAVCAKVNDELVDMAHVLNEGDKLEIVTLKDKTNSMISINVPISIGILFCTSSINE